MSMVIQFFWNTVYIGQCSGESMWKSFHFYKWINFPADPTCCHFKSLDLYAPDSCMVDNSTQHRLAMYFTHESNYNIIHYEGR